MTTNIINQWQFGLAAIFCSLGFVIHSIPSAQARLGPVVSYGNNPIWSKGGVLNGTVVTATETEDMVITDLQLSLYSDAVGDCWFTKNVVLSVPSLGTVGEYSLTWLHDQSSGGAHIGRVDSNFQSGIRIPAGESLSATVDTPSYSNCSSHGVRYTVSGYYAHTP